MDKQTQACERLLQLFDEGSFVEIDRLARDGETIAGVAAGYGTVEGAPVYAYAQDHDICCGAVSRAQAAKISKIYQLAAQNGTPIVAMFDSDGAKLNEGLEAMDAIADILLLSNNLSGVVPQIAVVVGACIGSASLIAANADVVIATKTAAYYLNPGDDNAAALTVEDVSAALEKVKELLAILPANNLADAAIYDVDAAEMPASEDANGVADAHTVVRLFENDGSVAALARIGGFPCGLVTLTGDQIDCCTAAQTARFVRLCDGFSLPVLTFVDAAGFACMKGAAKLSHAYAETTAPKITVITGRAYGAVYIAVAGKSAGADMVFAWPSAVISALAPHTAIEIFWQDRLAQMKDPLTEREALSKEYAHTMCSPLQAAAGGFVTDVIAPAETKEKLIAVLEMLSGKRVTRLPKKHSNIVL